MATVKDALDLTTRTIDRRAYRYRNLVVVVVLLGLASGIGAVALLSLWPLLGLLLLLPLCGGFHYFDSVLVNRWSDRILRMWVEGELDLDIFVESVASIRLLPPATLGAMLSMLPKVGDRRVSQVLKQALAKTLATRCRCASDRTAARVVSYTCIAAVVIVSIITGTWTTMIWTLCFVPVQGSAWCLRCLRWRFFRRALLAMHRHQGLDVSAFFQLVGDIRSVGIPESTKRQLIVDVM